MLPEGASLHDSNFSTASSALLEVEQWTVVVGIVAGIEDLNTGIVIAVERCHRSRAAGFNRVRRVGEPYPEVVGLNRSGSGRQDESFVIENTSDIENPLSLSIGGQVTLIPGRDKW